MKKGSIVKITAIAVCAALLAGLFVYVFIDSRQKSAGSSDELLQAAKSLRAEGDTENAYYQLELYLQERGNDREALTLMGDWLIEDGESDKGYGYYGKVAALGEFADDELYSGNTVHKYNFKTDKAVITITPTAKLTKDMKLNIMSENLAQGGSDEGKIDGSAEELVPDENCRTTKWFEVDNTQPKLTLSGGINCAVWQFRDESGIITSYRDEHSIHAADNTLFTNSYDSSAVNIPSSCKEARVTYLDKSIENTITGKSGITVAYSSVPDGCADIKAQQIVLPDLSEGQTLTYSDGKWTLDDNGEKSEPKLEKINTALICRLGVEATVYGKITVTSSEEKTEKGDKTKQYGVTFKPDSGNVACRRTLDAQSLSFDYKIEDSWAKGTGNDFDSAYPWSGIRRCCLKIGTDGSTKVIYEGESGFAADGSAGNVMVEIPKFYVKRTVKDGAESISVSGTRHDGYELEPVFVNSDGSESESVYIAAYLAAKADNKLVSVSGGAPVLGLDYGTTLEYAEANGDGFSELNYAAVSAVQKLFLVETACLDSSAVFSGDTQKYHHFSGSKLCALESAESANRIVLDKNSSYKLSVGTDIILFSGKWSDYSDGKAQRRQITDIKRDGDLAVFTFDGEPVNITKDKTYVSGVPETCGKTDSLDYCTGELDNAEGRSSFRYRWLENIYGSASVMLSKDAFISDGVFQSYDADGNYNVLSSEAAVQEKPIFTSTEDIQKSCVAGMAFDAENPTVMIPAKTGSASVYSGYCDAWRYGGGNMYLLYGGCDISSRLAGIFNMEAVINSDDYSSYFSSARIMYKK